MTTFNVPNREEVAAVNQQTFDSLKTAIADRVDLDRDASDMQALIELAVDNAQTDRELYDGRRQDDAATAVALLASVREIQSQIDVLNADFRLQNSNVGDILAEFQGRATDTEIQFCMATVDPNGQPTNGITRTQTNKSVFDLNDDMKRSNTKTGLLP